MGLAAIQLAVKKVNPFKGIPRALVKDLLVRSVAGQVTFGVVNYTFTLLPIGTALIIF